MDDKEKALKEFLEFKEMSVKSKRKINDMKRYVGKFVYFVKNIEDPSEQELVNFINTLKDYKPRSRNDIKVFLKNFIKWKYEDFSKRFRNLDKICRTERGEIVYQPEEHLSIKDIQKLIDKEESISWKTYLATLFYSGSRPQEICKLKWKDIRFVNDGAYIKIYSGKNKEFFDKFVPVNVSIFLEELKNNNSDYVFPSPKDLKTPITESAVWKRLTRLSKEVLKRNVNPYLIRHSIATILYNDPRLTDKKDVARQMGHSENMRKTYDHPTKEMIDKKLRNIWLTTEDLPPEQKNELLKRIEQQDKKISGITKGLEEIQVMLSKFQESNPIYKKMNEIIKQGKTPKLIIK